jgi:hypothetical protein
MFIVATEEILIFAALVVVVAFSGVAMANSVEVTEVQEKETEKKEI